MFACSPCSEQELGVLAPFYSLEFGMLSAACSPRGWSISVWPRHTQENKSGIVSAAAAESQKQHHKSQSSPNWKYFKPKADFSLSQHPGDTCKIRRHLERWGNTWRAAGLGKIPPNPTNNLNKAHRDCCLSWESVAASVVGLKPIFWLVWMCCLGQQQIIPTRLFLLDRNSPCSWARARFYSLAQWNSLGHDGLNPNQHFKWYFASRPWAATVKQKYCLKGQFPEAISILIYLGGSEFESLRVRIKYPVENREFSQ